MNNVEERSSWVAAHYIPSRSQDFVSLLLEYCWTGSWLRDYVPLPLSQGKNKIFIRNLLL